MAYGESIGHVTHERSESWGLYRKWLKTRIQ